ATSRFRGLYVVLVFCYPGAAVSGPGIWPGVLPQHARDVCSLEVGKTTCGVALHAACLSGRADCCHDIRGRAQCKVCARVRTCGTSPCHQLGLRPVSDGEYVYSRIWLPVSASGLRERCLLLPGHGHRRPLRAGPLSRHTGVRTATVRGVARAAAESDGLA